MSNSEDAVQHVLRHASAEYLDENELLQSLLRLIEYLNNHSLSVATSDRVCQFVIENVLAELHLLDAPLRDQLSLACEAVLLYGEPYNVFRTICLTLKTQQRHPTVYSRLLSKFVGKKPGGLNWLTRILLRLDSQQVISFLVHLPSLISNAVGTTQSGDTFLHDSEYFSCLSEAICNVSETSDMQRSFLLATLIQRLVTTGKADVLITSCVHFCNGRYLQSVLMCSPHSCVHALIRGALEVECPSEGGDSEQIVRSALRSLVLRNATAADACVLSIPFAQPPLRKQRTALNRLVDAVSSTGHASTWKRAVTAAANVFNSQEFAFCAQYQLQRQVTRLILCYMTTEIRERSQVLAESEGLLLDFSAGIQLRLDDNDPRIRRHAMLIGEAVAKTEEGNQKLKFPREGLKEDIESHANLVSNGSENDDSDSDLSALALDLDTKMSSLGISSGRDDIPDGYKSSEDVVSEQRSHGQGESSLGKPMCSSANDEAQSPRHEQKVSSVRWDLNGTEDGWQSEDDWSSVETWEQEDESAVELLREIAVVGPNAQNEKNTRVPVSVTRLLNMMVTANKSDGGGLSLDADTVANTLNQISVLHSSGLVYKETLRRAAVDICLEVARLDIERFPDEHRDSLQPARERALEEMIVIDFRGCATALIDKVCCGPTADLSSRIESLAVLTKACRLRYDRPPPPMPRKSSHRRIAPASSFGEARSMTESFGGESPIESISVENISSTARAREIGDLQSVFHHLAQCMCEGGGADFLQLESRDTQLWGYAVIALATMAACGGSTQEGRNMRVSVIEVGVTRVLKIQPDSTVRRAVVLAIVSTIRSMGEEEVRDLLGSVVTAEIFPVVTQGAEMPIMAQCFDWLTHVAEHDADIGVRRFARQALGVWAKRTQLVK